ncbi:MAG: acyltransferase [Desulfofustis sp.]|jgi:acetyltransferase-like isoleucine patch superfamily enzyme
MEKTHKAVTGKGSALKKYRQIIVGSDSPAVFLYYEWCQLLGFFPGAVGMALRKIFWPKMFKSCGKGTVFGYGVVVRQPGRIELGVSVVISEYCILDGRTSAAAQSITVGDRTILSNNVMLSSKDGSITIGSDVGINAQTIIQSTTGNAVEIGNDCVIGQRCLIIGGGNYDISDPERLTRVSPIVEDGGVAIENNVWLGANVSVLGGVTVARGSVAGAGALLSRSVPPFSVCLGVPAKVVRKRS